MAGSFATSDGRLPFLLRCIGFVRRLSSISTRRLFPAPAAKCSAFSFLYVSALGFAPELTSSRAASQCPFWQAKCRGDIPSIASTDSFAPDATRNLMASTCGRMDRGG